tara:strand:- start:4390 stop:5583 length:1194 start_codon:yes stop_codon:yes gene_type:complete
MAADYTNIDEVVNDFQLMIDDTSYDKEAKIYQLRLLAYQGLRELKFDTEQEVKTASREVNSNLQIDLPADFVKLLRAGFKGSDGNFHALGHNPDLSLDASITPQVGGSSPDENNPYYHVDLGKKFGIGGGNNNLGYYRLNKNDNTINFSSDLAGKTVFMEYISDGISRVMPRDHIIKLTFNTSGSSVDDNIVSGTTLIIPALNSSLAKTFTFSTDTTSSSNTTILFSAAGGATGIAEKFSTLINEGYPEFKVVPYGTDTSNSSSLKASHSGNVVLLTYNNSSSVPRSVYTATFNPNTNDSQTNASQTTNPLTIPIELIQLGVVGDSPRVHKFCEEALRCYMYYKYIQKKRGVPANEKQMAKRAFYNEKRLARARMMSFSKETALQTSRKAFKQSPKF